MKGERGKTSLADKTHPGHETESFLHKNVKDDAAGIRHNTTVANRIKEEHTPRLPNPSFFETSKIIATSTACVAAASITYPAEMHRLSFTNTALATWNFERNAYELSARSIQTTCSTSANSANNSAYSIIMSLLRSSSAAAQQQIITPKSFGPFADFFTQSSKRKQKIRIVFSPMVRLTTHELALAMTTTTANNSTANTSTASTSSPTRTTNTSFLIHQMKAGIIAGLCQTLLLCPLEIHRANQVMYTEEQEKNGRSFKHWMRWMRVQLYQGGNIGDPYERRRRALNGVGLLAVREIMFNLCFFPSFYYMRRYLDGGGDGDTTTTTTSTTTATTAAIPSTATPAISITNVALSGVVSGLVCSLAMIPLDVCKTYLFYSREQWNIWTGKNIVGPPFRLLGLGLSIQAMIFGPTFGIVAAIYELT